MKQSERKQECLWKRSPYPRYRHFVPKINGYYYLLIIVGFVIITLITLTSSSAGSSSHTQSLFFDLTLFLMPCFRSLRW